MLDFLKPLDNWEWKGWKDNKACRKLKVVGTSSGRNLKEMASLALIICGYLLRRAETAGDYLVQRGSPVR